MTCRKVSLQRTLSLQGLCPSFQFFLPIPNTFNDLSDRTTSMSPCRSFFFPWSLQLGQWPAPAAGGLLLFLGEPWLSSSCSLWVCCLSHCLPALSRRRELLLTGPAAVEGAAWGCASWRTPKTSSCLSACQHLLLWGDTDLATFAGNSEKLMQCRNSDSFATELPSSCLCCW